MMILFALLRFDERVTPEISAQPDLSLPVGQVSGTARHRLLKYRRTGEMVALTRDLHVFASGVATRISAVLFSICYISKAWYVRAFYCLLTHHNNLSLLARPTFPITRTVRLFDVASVAVPARMNRGDSRGSPVFGGYVLSTECMLMSKVRACRWHHFPMFVLVGGAKKIN